MQVSDILFENGKFWVLKDKHHYTYSDVKNLKGVQWCNNETMLEAIIGTLCFIGIFILLALFLFL
jgi:hypothetical protein